MNKKLLVYTLTAFFLLGIYLRYFFYSQQNTNTNLEELDKVVYFSGKTSEFAVEPEDSDSIFSTGELVQIENLFKNKSVDELQQLAVQLQKLGDLEKAIKIIQKINTDWQFDKKLLSLYEKTYKFDKIKELLSWNDNLTGLFLRLYLKSQLNLLDTDINAFSAYLDTLKAQSLITTGEWTFYKGLTALYKGHFEDFEYFFIRIPQDSPYYQFRQNVEKQLNKYESFRDVPSYYKDALIAYELFKIGYIWLAQKMAFSVYASKPSYILPNQILAYSYFLQWQRQKAQKYLKNLLRIDQDNKDFYALLLGITYFYLQDYSSAISYLHMAKNFDLSYHFLIASLVKKWDIDETLKVYYPLSLEGKLTDQEYWILFKYLFLEDRALRELTPQQQVLLSKVVNSCYQDAREKRICDLGQAWLMLSQGHPDQAAKYLEQFVDYYPSDNLLARLGNRWKDKDVQKAKQFYLKAVVAASNNSLKNYYKKQILDLILKKKDK